MIEDPFSYFYPLYVQIQILLVDIGDRIPDAFDVGTRLFWLGTSSIFLYKGISYRNKRRMVERIRIREHRNGLYKIRSIMWIGLANDFIQQALAMATIGVIAVLTPIPVRAQLTLLQVATSLAFIFIVWKSYTMVTRVNNADQNSIRYSRANPEATIKELDLHPPTHEEFSE